MASAKPIVRIARDPQVWHRHKGVIEKGVNALLPQHYKNFYLEWKAGEEEPVNYVPEEGRWKKNPETGEIKKVVNFPIPIKYPKEFDEGLWGGEGVIQGFKKRKPLVRKFGHFWVPTLLKRVVYSEILDKRFEVTCTHRFLELVVRNYGFDNYILKTPPQDLKSVLALRFRRQMLIALAKQDMYPDDPLKKAEVLDKYGHLAVSLEEAEWYGLTLEEAVEKLKLKMAKENPIQPLKLLLRQKLFEDLKSGAYDEAMVPMDEIPKEKRSWMSALKNPFAKSS